MRFGLTNRVGPTVRSFGWGLLDQMLSSVTNFALNILVARAVSPRDFGAFSLAYATYTLALGATRALALEPLVVRFSAASEDRWRSAAGSAAATSLVIGAVIGMLIVLAAAVATADLRTAFVLLGIALPGLLLQDAWRFSFFASGRGDQAFLNDLVWAAALLPAAGLLLATGNQSITSLMAVWAASGWIAAAVGLAQGRILPRLDQTISWLRDQRDLSFRYFGEFVVSNGATQLSVVLDRCPGERLPMSASSEQGK